MPPTRVLRQQTDPLQFLTAARTVIVAGKGGVGKTTVTALWARAAFRRGLRVLAVEMDGKPTLAHLLPNQPTLTLTASEALAEYLETHGLGRVVKRLVSSGVVDIVATAAPGIDDIVVLGKLKQLERSGEWDLIVVDGPAAGQAITMLMAPASLHRATRSGPIRAQADEVASMLADPARCQVALVTLPETTPVNELAETAAALRERVGVWLGPVVVNGVDSGAPIDLAALAAAGITPGDPVSGAMHGAAAFTNGRRALHAAEVARVAELGFDPVAVPLVSGARMTAARLDELAEAWAGAAR